MILRSTVVPLILALGLRSALAEPSSAAETEVSRRLLRETATLASDAFEGRGPGTKGEEKTVDYLTRAFRRLGLSPGNPNGSFVQPVTLVGYTAQQPQLSYVHDEKKVSLNFPADFVIWSKREEPVIDLKEMDLIFVGYGVVAPEYAWDDYKDVDVRGKILVMLINDPAVPDPAHPGQLDPALFKGKAMTYYGRWTYKYEIALAKGALGALIIHETGPAAYPYAVVVGSNSRENFDLEQAPHIPVEGWLSLDAARALFTDSGHDLFAFKKLALRRDFKPIPLGTRAHVKLQNKIRKIESRNVVGFLPGSDPARSEEHLVVSAHWDHLGRDPKLPGDQIYNGAQDNASGTAALLELARSFSRLKPRPPRSVLFLAPTAEEKGLLGAKYYVEHPLYPLSKAVANLNFDGINVWGRTKDIENISGGTSTLDDLLADVARAQDRVVSPDSNPEKGSFYRSDHFEFAKAGVPSIYLKPGTNYLGKPAGFGQEKYDAYIANDYHKVTDEVKPGWDLSGGAEDVALLFTVGRRLLETNIWPAWKKDSEFKRRP